MKSLTDLVRPAIQRLTPYSCARNEYQGTTASVFLDANENPYNGAWNRYPDPLQRTLKQTLGQHKQVDPAHIFLGNGSDEAIDLIYRIFCQPGEDNVVAMSPTYGMYQVCADINDVEYRAVPLCEDFQLDTDAMLAAADDHTKVMWVCSPNNPTANLMRRDDIVRLLTEFPGIVVVDEAYIDFADATPFRFALDRFPNLVVLSTCSKLWGAAAIRLGMAFASTEIIDLFNKVKYPYNISLPTQQAALDLLRDIQQKSRQWRATILAERNILMPAMAELPICRAIYRSDANFFLMRVTDADAIYAYLVRRGIIVRNRNRVELCGNCLRITVGTPAENNALLGALRQYRP